MIMRLRRNQKGFTLLEVMLVVIIIGIIAVIALPRLLVTRARARDEACDSNVQAIRTQIEQYYWAFHGWPADLEDFITTNTDFFPADSTVSSRCPQDADGDGLGDTYTYGTDGSVICPNHSSEPTGWL
jgi:prepilin-type N-terminal cleavage/methylation domain-containing protein